MNRKSKVYWYFGLATLAITSTVIKFDFNNRHNAALPATSSPPLPRSSPFYSDGNNVVRHRSISHEESTHHPLLSNPADWIISQRQKLTYPNLESCMDGNGDFTTEQFISWGVNPDEIDHTAAILNDLKFDLKRAIEDHFSTIEGTTHRYIIMSYRDDADKSLSKTFTELKKLLGSSLAERIMISIPVDNFIGVAGRYDVTFEKHRPDQDTSGFNELNWDDGINRVYSHYKESEINVRHVQNLNDFSTSLLNSIDVNGLITSN